MEEWELYLETQYEDKMIRKTFFEDDEDEGWDYEDRDDDY